MQLEEYCAATFLGPGPALHRPRPIYKFYVYVGYNEIELHLKPQSIPTTCESLDLPVNIATF